MNRAKSIVLRIMPLFAGMVIVMLVFDGMPAQETAGRSGDPLSTEITGENFRALLDFRLKVVEAEGWGASRADEGNMAQRKVHALEEARRTAYLRLAESIGNIRLSGMARLSGTFMTHSETIASIEGWIQGARVTDERVSFRKDGSALAQVRLRLPLLGADGLTGAIWKKGRHGSPFNAQRDHDSSQGNGHTGIILLAGKNSVTLGLAPRIILPGGRILYSPDEADSDWLTRWGAIAYVTDADSEKERTGKHPLFLRATPVPESPDFILDDASARDALGCPRKIWRECRVVALIE